MLDWEEGLEQHRISRAGANRLGDLIAGLGGRTLRLTRFPGTRFEIRPHSEPGDYLEIHLRRELKAPLPFLVKKLKSPESSERVHAALDLAVAGDQASQAIPALIEALSDGDPEVSWAASYALGLQDEAAIPLLSVLESGDLRAREGAARSLQSLGKAAKPAIPALQALIDAPDTSSRLRLVAREALRVIYAGGR
jgi:HEAT repeat protein